MTTERGILMSAPMIRAILSGTKTQTRRVVKPQPRILAGELLCWKDDALTDDQMAARCPYGQPGDRLWVRETWQAELRWDWTAPRDIRPGSPVYFEFGDEAVPACAGKKRPGMFMPRWASRILLAVTGVRVERLQDISEADALAEGCPFPNMAAGPDPRDWYRDLWNEINGAGAWDANPWCWVVEFKRVEVPSV